VYNSLLLIAFNQSKIT